MFQISESQRVELERWAYSQSLSAADVLHARLILALADGLSYRDIINALQISTPTIARWKKRFEERGIEGLEVRHKGSQARIAGPTVTAKIASLMNSSSSYRKIADELAVSKSTIHRISAQNHSKPHRLERYMARLDGATSYKPTSIIGLYLRPPQHVAAFSIGEPVLGSGLQPLRLALDAGGRSPTLTSRRSSRQFALFCDTVTTRFRTSRQIHIILDNVAAHKALDVELFLATHPHVHLHFLQSYKKWQEHVGHWFSEIPAGSDNDFNIQKYLRAYAKSAEPFWWILGERNR